MKNIKIILIYFIITASIYGQNIMSIPDIVGESGDTVEVRIDIENSENFVAFQTDIILPNQVEYITNSATLTSRSNGHSMSVSAPNENTLRCLAFSLNQSNFQSNSGTVLTFNIILSTEFGSYPIILENSVISNNNSQNILTSTENGNIEIIDGTVPVELNYFKNSINSNGMLLEWETATEINNLGFIIQKSDDENEFKEIAFINGNGTNNEKIYYSFIDKDYNSLLNNRYRLIQIDYDGKREIISELFLEKNLNQAFQLSQNYPNPFNPSTTIEFTIPNSAVIASDGGAKQSIAVTLKIFDILGNEIITLINEQKAPGNYKVNFNASKLSSGVYYYKLNVDNYSEVKKMILIK